jgi:hypothetical protein
MKSKFYGESEGRIIMAKKIIYTDEFGNKIDVNTIEGIHTIFNDILSVCETENSCMCVKENVKASINKCYNTRIEELETGKEQDKSIW